MATSTVNGLDEIRALVGKDLGHSAWLEISQERVNLFADATEDHQWIHVDPGRAAAGSFGTTIAHGYLTLSLVIPLFNDLLQVEGISMGINYGLDKLRFPAPVKVGSKIRLGAAVAQVGDVPGGLQALIDMTIEIEGEAKPALAARAIYRYYA
jgi:acyl dehydratase